MIQKQPVVLIFMILFSVVLSSCDSQAPESPPSTGNGDTPSPAADVTSSTPTPPTEPVFGLADIDNLEILILESFPVQVNALIQGILPDGCTQINDIVVEQDGDVFNIAVTTIRESEQSCTEAETPFEETVPLDVIGLDAGSYTVIANDVSETFTLDMDNEPLEDPAASATEEPTTGVEVASYTVDGLVWHDLCTVPPDDAPPSSGCVATDDGGIRADGLLENEPGIEGVQVNIGEGECPAESLATAVTDADGNYSFEELTSGTYCISIDPTDEGNQDILIPGEWTAPEDGLAEVSVALSGEDLIQTVNFGWDFQFLPAPDVDLESCTNSFEFVEDLNIPDDTTLAPGTEFTKSWRLRNNGTCPWSTEYSVVFVGGDQMSAEASIPLDQSVVSGQTLDVAIEMIAPDEPGTYRGNWQFADAAGEPFGIDGFIEDAFWLRIIVAEDAAPVATPLPNSGTIGGVVWDDFCLNSDPGRGCLEFPEDSGIFIADGTFGSGEFPLSEITISLAEGACSGEVPSVDSIIETAVTDEAGLYRFENLSDGTYCIFMDALSQENVDFLIPGNWTWPATGVGRYTFILDPGEQALDLDFGWDYAD